MDERTGAVKPQQLGAPEAWVPVTPGESMGVESSTGPDLSEIRARIRQTEAEMAKTLDAIQEKLSFENIKREAEDRIRELTFERMNAMLDHVREKARDYGSSASETIRQHPVPFALVGLGLSLALMGGLSMSRGKNGQEQQPRRKAIREGGPVPSHAHHADAEYAGYTEGAEEGDGRAYRERLHKGVDALRARAGGAQHRAEEFAGHLKERARELGGEARHRAHDARGKFSQAMQENPLIVGISILALGTAVGLLIPTSRWEQGTMAETRHTLLDRAREYGHETMERAEHVIEKARRAAREEAEHQDFI